MRCSNKIGHFICLCQPGYRKIGVADECVGKIIRNLYTQYNSSKFIYLDIDECQTTSVCNNGICDNIEGSYRCRCDEGFEYDEDGKKCVGKTNFITRTIIMSNI